MSRGCRVQGFRLFWASGMQGVGVTSLGLLGFRVLKVYTKGFRGSQ